jgi:phage tail-like protein
MAEIYTDMLERIYAELPRMYRNMDINQKYQLKRYIEVLVSGGLYPVYAETQGLLNLNDFDRIPKQYLPHLASVLGFKFPYDLDEQTQRTYIKMAVAGYKKKGTLGALTFMIRELTRFKTTVDVFNDTRQIDITLDVDMNRQDFNRVVDKVNFLVTEYAPPYQQLNIINRFVWNEDKYLVIPTDSDTVNLYPPLIDVGYEQSNWFITNFSLTNDTPTYSGEFYMRDIQEDYTDVITKVY